ncbi:MAG: helix-turn-helix domain-containing protein [Microbacteriaceae bacterium]
MGHQGRISPAQAATAHAYVTASTANIGDIEWAAAELGTSVRHVRALVFERKIDFYKVGRLLRFSRRDIDAYLARNRVEAVR